VSDGTQSSFRWPLVEIGYMVDYTMGRAIKMTNIHRDGNMSKQRRSYLVNNGRRCSAFETVSNNLSEYLSTILWCFWRLPVSVASDRIPRISTTQHQHRQLISADFIIKHAKLGTIHSQW
jgi:hypothetical protein